MAGSHRVFLRKGEAGLVIAGRHCRVDFVASARQRAACWSTARHIPRHKIEKTTLGHSIQKLAIEKGFVGDSLQGIFELKNVSERARLAEASDAGSETPK